MATDLRGLYERFDGYLGRLNADLEMAMQRLPEATRAKFLLPRLDFGEFCAFWTRVSADPEMGQRWADRLAPGGYEAEREAVERALDRCSRAVPTAGTRRKADGREAA